MIPVVITVPVSSGIVIVLFVGLVTVKVVSFVLDEPSNTIELLNEVLRQLLMLYQLLMM